MKLALFKWGVILQITENFCIMIDKHWFWSLKQRRYALYLGFLTIDYVHREKE